MPRRTKPTAESPASSDTPGDARRLAELIDLQHQLLLGFATGAIDMAAASGAFGEAQEEIRAVCGRLGAIRPPFPWGSLEAWKWEAKGFADAADIDARLGQYRSQVDAVIAVLTGEPPWTLYLFADDQASFSRDLADLDAPKLDALQVALEEVLAIHGNAQLGKSQTHNSGRVRRTNGRFMLKTSASDFRRPVIDAIGGVRQSATPQDVVVGEAADHHRLWDLAGEEVSDSTT